MSVDNMLTAIGGHFTVDW